MLQRRATRHPHTTSGRRVATAARADRGGWVIEHADRYWHTDDESRAIDLVLPLVQEDRALAERIVRAPLYAMSRAPAVSASSIGRALSGTARGVGRPSLDGEPRRKAPWARLTDTDVGRIDASAERHKESRNQAMLRLLRRAMDEEESAG
jgi:hypothetical protein